jgi:hypothetical protein
MANFDGTDDYFDSRDVIERIAELELLSETMNDEEETEPVRAEAYDEYDAEEYEALLTLQGEAGDGTIPDFEYGETFISDDHFTDYAKELLKDTGYIPADLPDWIAIDWEATADAVKVDYTSFEFRGTTYWAR